MHGRSPDSPVTAKQKSLAQQGFFASISHLLFFSALYVFVLAWGCSALPFPTRHAMICTCERYHVFKSFV